MRSHPVKNLCSCRSLLFSCESLRLGSVILGILFCCLFTRPAFALIWYTNDAVITNTINDDIRVGDYNAGQSPTVTLTNGGVLNGGILVDSGILNLAGGQVNTTVPHLFQNYDRVNITGGNISSASVLQNYYFANMSGGTIDGEFRGELSAPQVITMTGGYAHLVNIRAGVATIRGMVDNINTSGSGQVKLETGGAMLQQLLMINTSTNHIHGGLEMGDLIVGQGASKCFLYGTNWTSMQIVTNASALDGFYDVFRINGLAEDGMQVKQLEFYRKVGSTSSVQFVNTNISFPIISAELSNSTELQLKWRSPSFGYVLQSTTNIANPTSWSDLAVTVTQSGSNNVTIVNATNTQTSYRLISR